LLETAILKLDEIKGLMDSSQLISEIETGFVIYCAGQDIQIPKMVDYALHTGDQA
jgi:hypothetical protein